MASMTNLTVDLKDGGNYTWNAMTPGSSTEASRWRGNSLAPAGVESRIAKTGLSYKYRRNAANNADRIDISGYVPIVCTGESCLPKDEGRVPFSFTVALPDALTDAQRSAIVDVIVSTLHSDALSQAMVTGSGFY